MICPGCGTLNSRDHKFCSECGGRLESVPFAVPLPRGAAPAVGPDDARVQRLLDQAFQAFDAGNHSDATLACEGALALRPESTAAHSLLGLVYERQGRFDDAVQQYRVVLDLNPGSDADRAKLDALLQKAGQPAPRWFERPNRIRLPALAAVVVAGLGLVAGALSLVRATTPPARAPRVVERTGARQPLVPAPATAGLGSPVTPQFVPPAMTETGPGAVPRRTLTNRPLLEMPQIRFGSPRSRPPLLPSPILQRQPAFLAPARIGRVSPRSSGTDVGGGIVSGLRPAPVLPDAAGTLPAPSAVAAPPSTGGAPVPPAPPTAPPGASAASSISIRRLDADGAGGAAAGNPGPGIGVRIQQATPSASLDDARQHYSAGADLRTRGDYSGAYREYQQARDLFGIINRRGGPEAPTAA